MKTLRKVSELSFQNLCGREALDAVREGTLVAKWDPRMYLVLLRVRDRNREGPPACSDCDLPYDDPGFQDLVVPDAVWEKIRPTGDDESGLLCPTCVCRRTAEAGIECRATFRSGPFAALSEMPDVPVSAWTLGNPEVYDPYLFGDFGGLSKMPSGAVFLSYEDARAAVADGRLPEAWDLGDLPGAVYKLERVRLDDLEGPPDELGAWRLARQVRIVGRVFHTSEELLLSREQVEPNDGRRSDGE